MYSAHQSRIKKRKSEQGFVLLATLLGVLILVAVSIFALTMTTQDLRTSGSFYCERRGMSAVDAALTALCLDFIPDVTGGASNIQVDPVNDPETTYSYTKPTRNSSMPVIPAIGSELSVGGSYGMVFRLFNSTITGSGGGNCGMTVEASLRFGPVPDDPAYR